MYVRIAFLIWLVSAACNAVLILTWLNVQINNLFQDNLVMLIIAFLFGLGVSLPAFLLLLIVLSFCEDHNLTSRQLLTVIIITCSILTVSTYLVFALMLDNLWFILFTSLVSVAIGIACQWKAIKKLSFDHLQPDSHEN